MFFSRLKLSSPNFLKKAKLESLQFPSGIQKNAENTIEGLWIYKEQYCAGMTGGKAVQLTSLLISSWRSGAERAVALIMVEVWLSVNFFMHRWPATILQTCRNEQKLKFRCA